MRFIENDGDIQNVECSLSKSRKARRKTSHNCIEREPEKIGTNWDLFVRFFFHLISFNPFYTVDTQFSWSCCPIQLCLCICVCLDCIVFHWSTILFTANQIALPVSIIRFLAKVKYLKISAYCSIVGSGFFSLFWTKACAYDFQRINFHFRHQFWDFTFFHNKNFPFF